MFGLTPLQLDALIALGCLEELDIDGWYPGGFEFSEGEKHELLFHRGRLALALLGVYTKGTGENPVRDCVVQLRTVIDRICDAHPNEETDIIAVATSRLRSLSEVEAHRGYWRGGAE